MVCLEPWPTLVITQPGILVWMNWGLLARATTIEEALPLLEQGFTEASDFNGVKIYRKLKNFSNPTHLAT